MWRWFISNSRSRTFGTREDVHCGAQCRAAVTAGKFRRCYGVWGRLGTFVRTYIYATARDALISVVKFLTETRLR